MAEEKNPLSEPRHGHVDVTPDHILQISRCHPSLGLAELIWNSLDADAAVVSVWLRDSPLGGVERIEVADDGTGIDITRVDAFERLGHSWKKDKGATDGGRSMHGRNGQGRFRACTIGRFVEWVTINRTIAKQTRKFTVSINTDRLKEVQISKAEDLPKTAKTGTTATITEIRKPRARLFREDALRPYLVEHFGHYLIEYPGVRVNLNGEALDPATLIENHQLDVLPGIPDGDGHTDDVRVRIIEWKKEQPDRRIFLCKSDGTTIGQVPMMAHVLDDSVSAYVSSPIIDAANVSDMAPEHLNLLGELQPLLKAVRSHVKAYLKSRESARSVESVKRWKDRGIYPFKDEPVSPIEEITRTVFHRIAAGVEEHLPAFAKADVRVQRLQFSLLKSALQSQPDALVELVSELTNLPATEREKLLEIIRRSSFTRIVRGLAVVDERLRTLDGLQTLLSDPKTRSRFKERTQLHVLLERSLWILDDNFELMGSDQHLQESLKKHLAEMEVPAAIDQRMNEADGRKRLDLFLTRAVTVPGRWKDHLVVELKRPSEKGGQAIINQMEGYAYALSSDPQWANAVSWTFWGIVYDLDGFGLSKSQQKTQPPGLVSRTENGSIWLKRWSEVLNDARGRIEFIRRQLAIESSQVDGVVQLIASHPDAIPVLKTRGGVIKLKPKRRQRKKVAEARVQ